MLHSQNQHLSILIAKYSKPMLQYARLKIKQNNLAHEAVKNTWENLYEQNKLYPTNSLQKAICICLKQQITRVVQIG